MKTALVIGAGPAGLMAAETLAKSGFAVTVADKMPSVGRKFLMAGKSGLNLTKNEDATAFRDAFHPSNPTLLDAVAHFGPEEVMAWATGLGQPIFTGSTGRVFPNVMKASPLLRAWLERLDQLHVTIRTRWTLTGWVGGNAAFHTPDGTQQVASDVTILALGGASWSRLGSDGKWAALLDEIVTFQPANMGFRRKWSEHMRPYLGQPIKGIALTAGKITSRGEIILGAGGIEGGGIYEVSRDMRDGHPLTIDLVPDLSFATVKDRYAARKKKGTLTQFLKSGLRLPGIKAALFNEVLHALGPKNGEDVCTLVKRLPISHDGPQPIDQAISTAGGVPFAHLTDGLMITSRPGIFCAGEMLDWEAPTGGYLITGCLATGVAAARAAVRWCAAE